jgi:hypothetical protein
MCSERDAPGINCQKRRRYHNYCLPLSSNLAPNATLNPNKLSGWTDHILRALTPLGIGNRQSTLSVVYGAPAYGHERE